MNHHPSFTVVDIPSTNDPPPKTYRTRRRRRIRDKRKRCPYCLWDLTDYDPEDLKEKGYVCPLCRHAVLDHLLTCPVHEFTRAQQWDHLTNEMDYLWKAGHVDVDSYIEAMGEHYNPDYKDAKELLFSMLIEKDALLRLEEEFIEAQGEMDLLMIGHLNKIKIWKGNLAMRLFAGRPFRIAARRLSMTVPSERERVEFQWGYIQACPWGAFESPEEKEAVVVHLEKMLESLSWDQRDREA
jgi:hypothetical protein